MPSIVRGDGSGAYPYATGDGSRIEQTSDTASVFTFSDAGWQVENIAIVNTEGAPTAGAGIVSDDGLYARMYGILVWGFYDNIDLDGGQRWSLTDSFIGSPVRYGLRIRGADDGDQSITGCYFMADDHNATAAIRQEGAGGLKIVNTKINDRGISPFGKFVDGIQVVATGAGTSILKVANSSIENVSGDAIDITDLPLITLTGIQTGLYSNNTGRAVKFDTVDHAVITGCVFLTDGTARAAMEFTDCDGITIGAVEMSGFNALYTGSGNTNITEGGSASLDLDDLTDVAITSPEADQQLQYLGGTWVNNHRRWEPVVTDTGSGPELVFDGSGDIVMTWADYS